MQIATMDYFVMGLKLVLQEHVLLGLILVLMMVIAVQHYATKQLIHVMFQIIYYVMIVMFAQLILV